MEVKLKRWCLAIAICLILSACGPEATPTPVPVISSSPLALVRLEDRLLASINTDEHPLATENMLGNHPEEIVLANGSIWIHLVNGHIVQVDSSANTIISAVKTDTTTDPNHYCQGLGTDGENIWVCSAAGDEDQRTIDVVRVDTSTGQITKVFEIGKIFDQLYMPFAQNQIWALTEDGSKLVGIDVSSNQVNPAIDLGVPCFHLASVDEMLLATCGLDNLVIKIDPTKKEIVMRQTIPNHPKFIAAGKDAIWVSQNNSVTRLDPESLSPIVTISGITPSDINVAEGAVWVWEYGKGILYRIDASTNEVMERIQPDDPFLSGGGVLSTPDSVWLTVDENDLLLRLGLN